MAPALATLLLLAMAAHGGTRPVRTPEEVAENVTAVSANANRIASEQSA